MVMLVWAMIDGPWIWPEREAAGPAGDEVRSGPTTPIAPDRLAPGQWRRPGPAENSHTAGGFVHASGWLEPVKDRSYSYYC